VGWLVLSVPNAGSLGFRIFGDAWYALQLPTHLYHFTPKTSRLLLEKSGWRTVRVFQQRVVSNLLASVGYVLEDRGLLPRVAGALMRYPTAGGRWPYRLFPLAYLLAALGQTGRMTIWPQNCHD
jgi:hypothetical protein